MRSWKAICCSAVGPVDEDSIVEPVAADGAGSVAEHPARARLASSALSAAAGRRRPVEQIRVDVRARDGDVACDMSIDLT
jgi:hypothetical protein